MVLDLITVKFDVRLEYYLCDIWGSSEIISKYLQNKVGVD